MTKIEIEKKDSGLLAVTSHNTLDGKPCDVTFISNEVILKQLVSAVKAYTNGELVNKDLKFSSDFGVFVLGIIPEIQASHVQWASYEELDDFSDGRDDDLVVLLGTNGYNPDHIFVRQATRSSVESFIEEGADDEGYIKELLLDSVVIHKDSIGSFEKAVEEALA